MEKPTQLPSGQWRQRYTGPDGKRHSTTDTSARKVQKRAALELAAMIEKAFAKEPEKTETRFDLFSEQLLQTRRPGEPGGYAVSVYPKRLNHLRTLNRTFGAHNVEDITPAQIRAWWNSLSATPAQRHTLYWFMHQIFEVALDDELIQRNPCRVKNAHENGSKGRPTFEDDAVEKIYKATEEKQMRAAVAVLRGTALRVGELVALDWEDLDFLEHTIPVMKHWTPWGIQPGTKTGPEHTRIIAMPAWVQNVLEDLFRGSDGEGPIFRNMRGGRLSVDGIETRFRKIRKKAELPTMHLHDIRHTALTAYARQPGVTLKDLMEFGGHRSERVAMKYQHASHERAVQHAATSMVPRWVKAQQGS